MDLTALDETLNTLTSRLLAERTAAGHWEGHLASSALATATATAALALADAHAHADSVHHGLAWLVAHQNADGGWGDTPRSTSNISTTALVWAAASMTGTRNGPSQGSHSAASREWPWRRDEATESVNDGHSSGDAVMDAEAWLTRAAGSLDPEVLVAAVARR